MTEIHRPVHIGTFLDIALIESPLLFKAGVPRRCRTQHGRKSLAGMRQVVGGATGQCGGDKSIVVALIGLCSAGLLARTSSSATNGPTFSSVTVKTVIAVEGRVIRRHLVAQQLHAIVASHCCGVEVGERPFARPPFGFGIVA